MAWFDHDELRDDLGDLHAKCVDAAAVQVTAEEPSEEPSEDLSDADSSC